MIYYDELVTLSDYLIQREWIYMPYYAGGDQIYLDRHVEQTFTAMNRIVSEAMKSSDA